MTNTSIKLRAWLPVSLFSVSVSVLLFGCSGKSGGPCDWYEYRAMAKVKSIEPYVENGDTLYHVGLQFNSSSLKDELQYMEDLQGLKIDKGFLQRNHIKKGYRYKYTVHEVKNGDCESPVVSFHHQLK